MKKMQIFAENSLQRSRSSHCCCWSPTLEPHQLICVQLLQQVGGQYAESTRCSIEMLKLQVAGKLTKISQLTAVGGDDSVCLTGFLCAKGLPCCDLNLVSPQHCGAWEVYSRGIHALPFVPLAREDCTPPLCTKNRTPPAKGAVWADNA
jgi:hypothetical protein